MTSQGTTTSAGPPGRADRARALLDAVSDLTSEEREAAFGELARLCGIDLGKDEQAWTEWLGKHPPGNDAPPIPSEKQLPRDEQVLSGLLEVAADQVPGRDGSPQADRSDFPALDGYELLARIGEGGMGTVYRARQLSLKRDVAVKVLQGRLAGDEAFIARFMREARLAAALAHPNVVRAIDVGVSGGRYYFAMELVDGETVRAVLRREETLPERRALGIVLQVARALDYARTRGLIHRDVKPDNILIDSEGKAMLADMGLARASRAVGGSGTRITRGATMVGTPDYVSPEQARGQDDIDTRADVYSLGATLFHMVTGRPPFAGESQADVISKHLNEVPPAAGKVNTRVSNGASLVVRMAMEKDRSRRYATPAKMASDVENLLRGEEPRIATTRYGSERGLRGACTAAARRLRRSRWGFPAIAATAAVGIALGVLFSGRWSTGVVEEAPRPTVQKEPPHAGLVRRARSHIAEGNYEEAIDLLGQARAYGDNADVRTLTEKAAYGLHVSRARAAEETGDLASAIRAYRAALQIRDDRDLLGQLRELQRVERIRQALEAGDRLLRQGDWQAALSSYRSGLEVARDGERDRLDAGAAAAERRGRHVQAMARGHDALERRAWEKALAQGEAALAALPEDKDALALVTSAKRGLEMAREERRREQAYERAMADARTALDGRRWPEAVARAEAALAVALDDRPAQDIIAQARRAGRREEEDARKETAHARAMAQAQEAKRAGDWRRVGEAATSALAARPGEERARDLLARAEVELSLAKETTNSIGMTFVLVTASEFTMGSSDGGKDERPVRRIFLESYYIGKHEVTNAQFERFRPGHCRRWRRYSPDDDMPAVCVSWEDAAGFCEWLGKREAVTYRLPTEAEWEKAARGSHGRIYPWGSQGPAAEGVHRANFAPSADRRGWERDGYRFASPVGSFAEFASPCGALDMAGNVWEWCLDWYAPRYDGGSVVNPAGPPSGERRVLRGGSLATGPGQLRASGRAAHLPGFCDASVGFRCVMTARQGATSGE